jgi:hypothetical protein
VDCDLVGVYDFEHQSDDMGDEVAVPGRQGMSTTLEMRLHEQQNLVGYRLTGSDGEKIARAACASSYGLRRRSYNLRASVWADSLVWLSITVPGDNGLLRPMMDHYLLRQY